MGYIILVAVIVCILAIIGFTKRKPKKHPRRYNQRGFDHNRIHKNGTKFDDFGFDFDGYDASGYNQYGYNAFGKNAKGQYNRLHDTKSRSEEGFLNPRIFPVALTDHARMRLRERLNISDYSKMNAAAKNAYCFGKSKRQIKKSSAYLVDEIERRHENGIILIYRNYIYVFSDENVLITVYKNDSIPL